MVAVERGNNEGCVTPADAAAGGDSGSGAYTNNSNLRHGEHWIPGLVEAIQTATTRR